MKFPTFHGSRLHSAWAKVSMPSWETIKRWFLLCLTLPIRLPMLAVRWLKALYQKRYRNSRSLLGRRSFLPPQIIFFPLMFVPLFLGAVIGLDAPVLVAILSGIVGAVMVFAMMDTRGMILVMFVLTFLVQGSAQYFGHIRQAPWLAVGIAGLFFMRCLLELTTQNRAQIKAVKNQRMSMVMVSLVLYLACFATSFLVNRSSISQLIASMKANLPMFGVLVALFWFHWGTKGMTRLWRLMMWITVLQLPVVVYQHFVVAARRAQGFDSVVGTFGGTQGAGGLSAIMVVFVITTLGYCLACWNRGLLSKKVTVSFVAVFVLIILMGEVKASFVWIPLITFIVLRKRALKNVFTLVTYGTVTTCLLLLIYVVYNALYWGNLKGNEGTAAEKLDRTGGYFFDTSNVDYKTGEVSRGASLGLWANDRNSSLPKRLIGYGPGASKTGGALGKGEVARRFEPLSIDSTTMSSMLWDIGILGVLAYTSLMITGIWTAVRFLWSGRGSEHQKAMVEACVASMLIMTSLLIYNRALTDEPTLQLLFLFMLGTIVQVDRYTDADEKAAPLAAQESAKFARKAHSKLPRRRPPVVYPGKLVRER